MPSPPCLPSCAYGPETTHVNATDGKEGASVGLWTMKGSGHVPGFSGAAKDAMIQHMLDWRRTPQGAAGRP